MPKKKKGGRSVLKTSSKNRNMNGGSFLGFLNKIAKPFVTTAKVLKKGVDYIAPVIKKSGIIGNLASEKNPVVGSVVKAVGLGKKRKGMRGRGNITSENVKVLAF